LLVGPLAWGFMWYLRHHGIWGEDFALSFHNHGLR
jgi:hypothetical protein